MDSGSVKSRLQANLLDFSGLTRQLLEVVARDGKTAGDTHSLTVLDKLIERNTAIQDLASTAVEMRSRQEEIDHVTQEAERRDKELMELQTKLQETEKILEEAVYRGRQKLASIGQAKNGATSPEDLIRYSHRISQASSTVSPVGWQPSDPRRPFPQDIEMRSGVLGRLTSGELSATGSKVEDNIMRIGAESKTPGMRLATGYNQNNNNTRAERLPGMTNTGFDPTLESGPPNQGSYEEPEVMTEDTSESSSDEG